MPLPEADRAAVTDFLRGRDGAEEAGRRAVASVLRDFPAEIVPLLASAVGDILYSRALSGDARRDRLLGYFERMLDTLLDAGNCGWDAIRTGAEKFLPELKHDLRAMLPLSIPEWKEKKFNAIYRAFSLDFRARATACSMRADELTRQRLVSFILDLLHDSEEKKTFLELVRADLRNTGDLTKDQDGLLSDLERLPVVRRGRSFSSVFKPADPPPQQAAATVLIVDPDDGIRRALKLGLNSSGFRVVEASNGFDAEDLIRGSPPDAIVLELRLPGVSGLVLLNNLRARKPPLPVVAMNLNAAMASEFEVSTYPALRFVRKPVTFTPVLQALQELLARKKA